MLALIQRISRGEIVADGVMTAHLEGPGILVLLGVENGDTEDDAGLLAAKIPKLRIFSDENGKMNLSLNDVGGGLIVVSNFTLCASYRKGNRPDYMRSAPPAEAERLYEHFISLEKAECGYVGSGVFGADMKVSITNDGPVTMQLDSAVLKGSRR